MTKDEFIKMIHKASYPDLLNLYNQVKKDTKSDAFLKQVQDVPRGDIHFNLLLSRMNVLLRQLDSAGGFDEIVHVPLLQSDIKHEKIEVKPLDLAGKERVSIKKNPLIDYEKLPDQLKTLYDANVKLESRKKTTHAAMKVEKIQAKCAELRADLLKIEDQQNDNWSKIDKWWNENKDKVPAEQIKFIDEWDPKQYNPLDLTKKIDTCRKYIQRYSNTTKEKQKKKLALRITFLNACKNGN